MVLKRNSITERLKRYDETLHELFLYQGTTLEEYEKSISRQWIIEHGVMRCATIIFDIADHILSGHYGAYSDSYEDSLAVLNRHDVISDDLYQSLKGLGGFRNILVHQYMIIEPAETLAHFHKAIQVFPQFAHEIQRWLDSLNQ